MIVDATQLRPAVLEPPISKSDAHRALALRWMLRQPLAPQDTWPTDVRRIAEGLRQLGTNALIDCGDGAAPFRILVALAVTTPGVSRLTGSPRLAARPHASLFAALQLEATPWPLTVTGRAPAGPFTLEGGEHSSQYATALTLAACYRVLQTGRRFDVELIGPTASRGYLDLTVAWARAAGFELEATRQRIRIERHRPVARLPDVLPDWSSLGYLLLMAQASGSPRPPLPDTLHPDRAVLDHLTRATLDAHVASAPDLAPTLAALALSKRGRAVLREVGILRGKESDRLAGILALAHSVGARAELVGDDIVIDPGAPPRRFTYDCRSDHRLTMAAVTLACLLHCEAELANTDGVDKSFPGFFAQAERIGVKLKRAQPPSGEPPSGRGEIQHAPDPPSG